LTEEQIAECVRLGAVDYIVKDDLDRLPHALTKAIDHARVVLAGRLAESSYQHLFENLPMAVFRATAGGKILHANAAAIEMFRFPDLESLLATSAFDLHVNRDDRRVLLARLETEEHVLDFDCRMRRADGTEFWFSRVVHAVREEDGQVIVWETIGRDTTDDVEAIRRLRESEASLRAVIETAPDAVVRIDGSGLITDWNSAAKETFGWTRAEAIGRGVAETIVPPDLREGHGLGLARVHPDGTSTLIGRRWDTFEGLRKDGERFPIELSVSRPIASGNTTEFVAFARDISERKQAELTLATSEEQLRSLLSGAPVALVTLDTDTHFTFAGGSVFTQLGIDAHSLIGKSLTEAFAERHDFAAYWLRAWSRTTRTTSNLADAPITCVAGLSGRIPKGR
jgi:PAS domain S-box-containing protein